MMQRILLAFTFTTFFGLSQTTQQKVQPPIAVKVEMPPANPLMHVIDVAIPGFIGALSALIAVWLTNKYSTAANAANRQHEHSFALKRDVLLRVTQLFVQTQAALRRWDTCRGRMEAAQINPAAEDDEARQAASEDSKAWNEYSLRRSELEQETAAASLAVSDELWKLAQAVGASITEAYYQTVNRQPLHTKTLEQVDEDIVNFAKSARKELGVVDPKEPPVSGPAHTT